MVAACNLPTVWGLNPVHLHDRFWASRGVQVVRQGEPSEIVQGAELFLLTNPGSLLIFDLAAPRIMDVLNWTEPDLLQNRIRDRSEKGYRDRAISDSEGAFVRFERSYGIRQAVLARICLTRDMQLARIWQSVESSAPAWQVIRRRTNRTDRCAISVPGHAYDRWSERELMSMCRLLVQVWKRPDSTIRRAVRADTAAWIDAESAAAIDPQCKVCGLGWCRKEDSSQHHNHGTGRVMG